MGNEWTRFNERNKFGRLVSNDVCEFLELIMAEFGLAIKKRTFNCHDLTISEINNLIINAKLADSFDSYFEIHKEHWLLPLYNAFFDTLPNIEPNIYFVSRDFDETIKEIERQSGHKIDLTLMI